MGATSAFLGVPVSIFTKYLIATLTEMQDEEYLAALMCLFL